jgi:hypothetical protein
MDVVPFIMDELLAVGHGSSELMQATKDDRGASAISTDV